MADKKIYINHDLQGNQIKNAKIHNVAALTDVTSPNKGSIAFRTTDNTMWYHDGTNWQQISAGGGSLLSWKNAVATKTNTIPVAPVNGERHLVTSGGDWNAHAGQIAEYSTGVSPAAWIYDTPVIGSAVIVQNEQTKVYVCSNDSPLTWTAEEWEATVGGVGTALNGRAIDVKYDNSTIDINLSNQIEVKAGGITGTQLNSSVAGAGLTGGGGSALAIGEGDGITVDADSISVNLDANGGLEFNAGSPSISSIKVKRDVTTGATVAPVAVGVNGVGVAVDNSTIVHSSGTLSVGSSVAKTYRIATRTLVANTPLTITHSLNQDKVVCKTYLNSTGEEIEVKIIQTSANALTLTSNILITADVDVVVVG